MIVMVFNEDGSSKEYKLESFDKEAIGFGRQSDCDIVFNNPYVAGIQGCLYKENGEWYIRDLGSTNGIFYNGKKIDEMRLIGGETITIASSDGTYGSLRFTLDKKKKSEFFAIKKRDIVAIVLLILVVIVGFIGSRISAKRERERIEEEKKEIIALYHDKNFNEALESANELEDGENYIRLIEGAKAFYNNDYEEACSKLDGLDMEDSENLYKIASEGKAIINEIENFDYVDAYNLANDSNYLSNEEVKGFKKRIYYETKAFSMINFWCDTFNKDINRIRIEDIMWSTSDVYLEIYALYADEEQMSIIFNYHWINADSTHTGVVTYENGELTAYSDENITTDATNMYDDLEIRNKHKKLTLEANLYILDALMNDIISSNELGTKYYTWIEDGQTEGFVDNLSIYSQMLDNEEIDPIIFIIGP
ncbi:MAG: FHA domain-containing protein [Lachnospiraceae bacterium]|nr:FHA domain-containing protein [Lachnospiraceae bacterium]